MIGDKQRAEDEQVKNSYRRRVNEAKDFYMKAMAAYLGNPKGAPRRYKKAKRKNYLHVRKTNVLPSTEKPVTHTKDGNTQTKNEIPYPTTTASSITQQAGTSTTDVE